MALTNGSLRLFRVFGIDVYLHWSWAVIAYWRIQQQQGNYSSPAWAALEYATLFLIVLLHEFGHALATKSVGGEAKQIVLWPLGGVAFVKPPNRPGAVLWCIAAGPLVNVVLLIPTIAAAYLYNQPGDFSQYVKMTAYINAGLLIFNMLPIYPLDGGQIFRALLWFFMGAGRSLLVAAIVGLCGAAAGAVLAAWSGNIYLIVMAAFAALYSWNALKAARAQLAYDKVAPSGFAPLASAETRHTSYACPACGTPPVIGSAMQCEACGQHFDPFADPSHRCLRCGTIDATTTCPTCLRPTPTALWNRPAVLPPPVGYAHRPVHENR